MAPHTAALLALSLLALGPSPGVVAALLSAGFLSCCLRFPDRRREQPLGGANDAEDCCLSVTQRPIPGYIVRAFRLLLIKDGCRVPAVVFTTLRGRQLCAPPDQPWVNRIIRRLQKNSAKNKHHRS